MTLGIREGQQVEVIEGLVAGESVVVLGHETLADQMPVLVERDGPDLGSVDRNALR